MVDFDQADAGEFYAKRTGLCVLESVQLRIAGKSFHDYQYSPVSFAAIQRLTDDQVRKELLECCGGSAATISPGRVMVPIWAYFSSFQRDFALGEAFSNPESASRLEIQLQFASKASYTNNHVSNVMSGCQLFYKEIVVPQRLEAQFKPKQRSVEICWNQIEDVVSLVGVSQEIDCSALLSSGNIRQIILREQTAAQKTGSSKDVMATTKCSNLAIKINGQELFDFDDATLRVQQLLQRYNFDQDHVSPTSYSFCAKPATRDHSGYLPSSNDKLTLVVTPRNLRVDVIVELEKTFTRAAGGRITKSDS